jgi:hypothetical protein
MKWRSGTHAANGFTVLTVTALLAVTGCGGSGTPRKTDPSASTAGTQPAGPIQAAANSHLIASADAICRRVNGQLTGASRPQPADISHTAPRNAAIELRAVAELSKLTPPASLARDWTQMLAYRRTLAQELVALARDANAGDIAGMRALGLSKKRVRQKLSQLAARDGFRDCMSVGTVSIATLFPTLRPAGAPAHPGG